MTIKIINFKNGEKLNVSLPLLIGEVIVSGDSKITVQNLSSNSNYVVWPVINGKFKVLVQLKNGVNDILIQHKSESLKISLFYEPLKLTKFIRIVYIKCADDDGFFQAPSDECNSIESACKRIILAAQMLQTFTYDKFKDHDLSSKSFCLEEQNENVICHIFTSSLRLSEAYELNQDELWAHFALELMNSPLRVQNDCKFLAFLSFTRYLNESNLVPQNHKEILKMTKGQVALGGGGLALFGSGCLHTWPESLQEVPWRFGDKRKIDRMKFMDDSANRGFYWACYSTGLGATLHELGHTFDLGHTKGGIMGRGFDDIYKYFIVDMFYYDNLFQKENNPFYFESFPTQHTVSLNPSTRKWSESDESLSEISDKQNSFEEQCFQQNSDSGDGNSSPEKPLGVPSPPDEYSNESKFGILGGAYWTRSSALILYYHKWFNENCQTDKGSVKFENLKISSPNGIQIIEFRNSEGTLFHHIEFPEGALEIDLKLCDITAHIPDNSTDFYFLAEDSFGNILKSKLNVCELS